MGRFSAAPRGAILIPKLRMHFAEFLNADSSVRLRMLSSPTCVGLRYGPPGPYLRDCFSARRLHALRCAVTQLARGSPRTPDLPGVLAGSPFRPGLPSPGCASPYASSHRNPGGCGNVDPLPIGYGSRPRLRGRLTLGQIDFTLETSGFRRTGISPVFSLLMPAFSLAPCPPTLTSRLHPHTQCSPTDASIDASRGFGGALSPVTLSAHDYSTSELLRTL
jgi:hypothetical protein